MRTVLTMMVLLLTQTAMPAAASNWRLEEDIHSVKVTTDGAQVAMAKLKFVISRTDCDNAAIWFYGIKKDDGTFEAAKQTVWVNETYPVTVRLHTSEVQAGVGTIGKFEVGTYEIDGPYLNREFERITLTASDLRDNSWPGNGLRDALKTAQARCTTPS